jgi:hypothetical protein
MARKSVAVAGATTTVTKSNPAIEGEVLAAVRVMSYIKDEKAYGIELKHYASNYRELGVKAHELLVSALMNLASSGNPARLNAFFAVHRDNDKQSIRQYIRRASIMNGLPDFHIPDRIPTEMRESALAAGKIVDFERGQWVTVRGHTSDEAKRFLKMCEQKLLNPDQKANRLVFDRNNIAEASTLGDADIFAALERSVSGYLKGNTESRTINLSDSGRKVLEKVNTLVSNAKNQFSLAEG